MATTPQPVQAPGAISAPALPDYSTYLGTAASVYNPGYQDMVSAYRQSAQLQTSNDYNQANRYLSQEPLVRQTYANLASELTSSQQTETTQAQQTGENRIGGARASLAESGISGSAQGSFRAPVTAEENQLQSNVASIASKYNIQQTELTDKLNANISDLEDQAAQAKAQGDQVTADTNLKLIDLQQSHDSQIASLAKEMFTTDNQNRQFELKMQMDQLNYNLQTAKLGEMEASLNQRTNYESGILQKDLAASQITAGKAIDKSATRTIGANGISYTDYSNTASGQPISTYQYLTRQAQKNPTTDANGNPVTPTITPADVVNELNSSPNPKDQQTAQSIQTDIQGLMYGPQNPQTLANVNLYLERKYPSIFGTD